MTRKNYNFDDDTICSLKAICKSFRLSETEAISTMLKECHVNARIQEMLYDFEEGDWIVTPKAEWREYLEIRHELQKDYNAKLDSVRPDRPDREESKKQIKDWLKIND